MTHIMLSHNIYVDVECDETLPVAPFTNMV